MLKGIRKFYKNNRIYCILMIISMFCIILMGSSVIFYFVNQSRTSPYGNRLDDIANHDLGTTLDDLRQFYSEQTGVLNVKDVRLQGKTIYISVEVEENMKNEEIQNIATSSLAKISDDNKNYYSLQFIFTRNNLNAYSGSKGPNSPTITWAKFSYDNETTTTTTTAKK